MDYRSSAFDVDFQNYKTCADCAVEVDSLGSIDAAVLSIVRILYTVTTAVTATGCAGDLKQHGRVNGSVAPIESTV